MANFVSGDSLFLVLCFVVLFYGQFCSLYALSHSVQLFKIITLVKLHVYRLLYTHLFVGSSVNAPIMHTSSDY